MKTSFDFERFEKYLNLGLCAGLQDADMVCIEAAVALCSGEVLNDEPSCVLESANGYATTLNDAYWPTPQARAKRLRRFALAHIGTRDLNDKEFACRLSEQTIRQILPIALRAVGLEEAALRCAAEGTKEAARAAAGWAAAAGEAVWAAREAAARAGWAGEAARDSAKGSARSASYTSVVVVAKVGPKGDSILTLSADIAAEILEEMKARAEITTTK